jgi:hypothetical protein
MHDESVRARALASLRAAAVMVAAGVVALAASSCSPAPSSPADAPVGSEWREFEGTWTAAGSRQSLALGADRKASVSTLRGSLLLSGPARPAVGFRAEAVVLNDSAIGMVGRAVWTELRGEGTATGNRIVGTIVGGTGRYAGASGSYEFTWRFVMETEDGTVQGQSVGLKGRVRGGGAEGGRR